MSILQLNNVTKKFGGLFANNNINFQVEEGEVLGLIGPNGAGKTTLFNTITGFYKPNNGSIHFQGKNITGWSPDKICKEGIVRTFQIVKVADDLSVLDNVIIGSFCRTWKKSEAIESSNRILKESGFDLFKKRDQLVKELTLFEKKLLQIARALATKPNILMLDEAMSGLTINEQSDMIKFIKDMQVKMKLTLIVIEHVMDVIMTMADRIVVMNGGKKIADDIPEKVVNDEEVINAYLGRD